MYKTQISTFGFFIFQAFTCSYALETGLAASGQASLSVSSLSPRSQSSQIDASSATLEAHGDTIQSKRSDIAERTPEKTLTDLASSGSDLARRDKALEARCRKDGRSSKCRAYRKRYENIWGLHTGDATYYATGLGACGEVSNDGSMIAAASHIFFDAFPGATPNPNHNPICGRKVRCYYKGRHVDIRIVDRCDACLEFDLDFSPEAFKHLGEIPQGRLHGMTWHWI